ncbi:hypothetical protein [Halopseudomonas sp.]|uniref:hypothetical protein n=1 Tax=Halopseudomonas sp. TaxID=2901191 RepID=UPI00311E4082
MSEPTSIGVGGYVLSKLFALLLIIVFAVILVAIVVMAMTQPKSTREWITALISTVVASICGGAFIVQYFDLHAWGEVWQGSVAIAGIHFVCGLPAWVFVRGWFAYADQNKGSTLTDMIKEIREAFGR